MLLLKNQINKIIYKEENNLMNLKKNNQNKELNKI